MKNRYLRLSIVLLSLLFCLGATQSTGIQEWLWYAGDANGTHYSPLAEINRGNVGSLKLAWEWKTGEQAIAEKNIRPGPFETTPLMIEGVLYLTTPYNRLVALDADTGRELWAYDPKATSEDGQATNPVGYVHRGVAAWRDRGRLRLFLTSHSNAFNHTEYYGAIQTNRSTVNFGQFTNARSPRTIQVQARIAF